jgi:uncharacterized protein with FMN-binding domain
MKKRPLLVITGTVLGTVGVLSYVPGSTTANPLVAQVPVSTRSTAPISTPTPTAATASPTTRAPRAPKQAATPTGSSSPKNAPRLTKSKTVAKARTKPAFKKPTHALKSSTTSTPNTTPAPTTSTVRKIDGSAVQTPFGPVQVQIMVQGRKIISVSALQSPQGGRSSYISQQAVPYLVQQTLAAQSANVQGVSGATYTSDAWAQSLQSALSNI